MCQAHTVCKNVKRKKENFKFKLQKEKQQQTQQRWKSNRSKSHEEETLIKRGKEREENREKSLLQWRQLALSACALENKKTLELLIA